MMHVSIGVGERIILREPDMMAVGFYIGVLGSATPAEQLGLTTFETCHLREWVILACASVEALHATMLQFTLVTDLAEIVLAMNRLETHDLR